MIISKQIGHHCRMNQEVRVTESILKTLLCTGQTKKDLKQAAMEQALK